MSLLDDLLKGVVVEGFGTVRLKLVFGTSGDSSGEAPSCTLQLRHAWCNHDFGPELGRMLLVTTLVLTTTVVGGSNAAQPNFVILFGDDWGFGDLGANWNGTEGMPVDPKWPRKLTSLSSMSRAAQENLEITATRERVAGGLTCVPCSINKPS